MFVKTHITNNQKCQCQIVSLNFKKKPKKVCDSLQSADKNEQRQVLDESKTFSDLLTVSWEQKNKKKLFLNSENLGIFLNFYTDIYLGHHSNASSLAYNIECGK